MSIDQAKEMSAKVTIDLQAKQVSPERALGFQAKAVMVVMIAMHLACFAVIFVGFSWPVLFVAIAMYVIRGMGVTTGYHRLLAHRSFKTNRVIQFLLSLAGGLAVQGGPLWLSLIHI